MRLASPSPILGSTSLASAELGVATENTIFVDDKEACVACARAVAMHAIQFVETYQIISAVNVLLDR